MHKIVLLRHGESVWNQEDLFTGWTDVDLSDKGRQEAKEAGLLLKEQGYSFDVAFTSLLKRAIRTLWIVLDEMDLMWIPVQRDWRLNERHYGALQGLNKAETAAKYGEQQVNSGAGVTIFDRRRWTRQTPVIQGRIHAIKTSQNNNFPSPNASKTR